MTSLGMLPKRALDRLLMQPWVAGPLHAFGNDLKGKKWVFVIGCYNSGTTLLAEMLQAHPRLDGMRNEGAFLSDSLPYPERLGWPRMWAACAEELRISPNDTERAARIRRQWSLWVRGNPDYVVEKSVSNVLRIEFFANNFEGAKFVHIVRDGYAVAAGIRRKANLDRWKNPDGYREYPIELCAKQWLESNRVVEENVKRGLPIITIRYEDLTGAPSETLSSVFEFIGVEPIDDAKAWGTMHIHDQSSEIVNMNASSIASLSQDDMDIVRRTAGSALRELRYE